MIDHDRLNQEVLQLPEVMQTLRGWWGDKAAPPGGPVDRRRIARIVFSNPAERQRLEGLLLDEGLPYDEYPAFIFYNKDLFKDAGSRICRPKSARST